MCACRASPKMQKAHSLYGYPVSYTILAECAPAELDNTELEAIQIFNSVENGFNTYSTPFDAPVYTGYGYGNTKYTENDLLKVFVLLAEGSLTYKEIEKVVNIPASTISSISSKTSHLWLFEKYPDIAEVLSTVDRKNIGIKAVSDKLSAKAKGISYKKIQSPDGSVHSIDNVYSFARTHGLAGNHLTEVLNGHRKSHKGWRLCQDEQVL